MTDFKVALRGTLQTTVNGDEILATVAEATEGSRNDVLMTPATTASVVATLPASTAMQPDVYDPQNIQADAFDLSNHTGNISVANVSDLLTVAASAAQGDLADTALQPADVGTAAYSNANDFALASQGVKADTALQPDDIGVTVQAQSASLQSWSSVVRVMGFDTFVSNPTSENLRLFVSDETGIGSLVFAQSPTLITPNLGTPSAINLANATNFPNFLESVVAGTNVTIDNTDPQNPVISATGGGGGGGGDFSGPASSTDNNFVLFNGTTGKLGKDGGVSAASFATATQGAKADTALQPAAIGSTVQGYDADLASWANVTRASGFDTFAATPSSANLRALLSDEVGTGAAYFVGGALGTPASANLSNATNLSLTSGVTGILPIANGGTNASTAAAARTNLGLATVASSGSYADLSNKPTYLPPRVSTTTSTATLTPNASSFDVMAVSAQAAALAIAAPTGTPVDGQSLTIRIRDNGTSRAITWNAIYSAFSGDLPTSTVINTTMLYQFMYNAATVKWDLFAGNPIPGKWS